ALLTLFISLHTKPSCEIILVDPGRKMHAPFSKAMVALGFSHSQRKACGNKGELSPFTGQILAYRRVE
ncbi:MAG: histidine kinase, partial [Paraglaciecola sp.]|nr:histidine kinase [Paraglaciecola sp.]